MKLLMTLAILVLSIGCVSAQKDSVTSLPTTKTGQAQIKLAKSFDALTVDGKKISLASYKGKVIIINYWATWCPPCVAEIPDLIELQKENPDKLQIIGISLDDNSSDVRQFMKKYKLNYPVVMGNNEINSLYTRVSAIPTTIIINRDFMMVQVEAGYRKADFFKDIVKRLSK